MTLLADLLKFCRQQNFTSTYLVAYSGGMDSHVLLHALAQLRAQLPIQLRAIYINHNLSPHAAAWSAHCAEVCAQLGVDFSQLQVDAMAPRGVSPENAARIARYAALKPLLTTDDVLLTAHHQDDQAETLLLQLCRGAGPKGLASMPQIKKFGAGKLARPLLNFPREQLFAYASQHNLAWIEDESNTNKKFSRNFIRHEILPILKQRWPQITKTITRSASHCGEAQQLLDEMAAADMASVAGSHSHTLSVSQLKLLSPKRQRQLMRYWLHAMNFSIPSVVKLKQIQQDMLSARADKQPLITWPGVELRRYRDDLYAMSPLSNHDSQQIYPWQWSGRLQLAGVGELHAQAVIGSGIIASLTDVTVRFRQGGEICRLPARNCTHDLKKLLQAWHVPAWERNRIPLIYTGERLAAAVGWFIDPEFSAKENEAGVLLTLNKT